MRFLFIAARKDISRRLADPGGLALWIAIPLLIGTLLTLVGGGDDTVPKARLLLVDEDATFVSGFVLSNATSGPLARYLEVERVSLADGRARIDAGDATALLILPRGFQAAVLGEGRAELRLVTNPAQRILPRMVEEGLDLLVEAAFYVEQLFGDPLRRIAAGARTGEVPRNEEIAGVSIDIKERLARLGRVLTPAVVALRTPPAAKGPPPTGGLMAQLMVPSMLFMSLLFVGQGSGMDLWEEKAAGTLRRAIGAPNPIGWFLGGKLLAATTIAAAVTLVALGFVAVVADPGALRLAAAFVWCAFAGAALASGFTFIQMLASTQRGASLVSTMIVFPLMMIGGSFFPFEAMPSWMVAIGRWTPNGLGVQTLKTLLFGTPQPGAIALATLGIAVPAGLAFAASIRRARTFALS